MSSENFDMRSYSYRALFEPGERRGNIVVTFPDVPEVVTQGRSDADARAMAEEALGLVLLTYLERGKPLPKPRARETAGGGGDGGGSVVNKSTYSPGPSGGKSIAILPEERSEVSGAG